MGHPAPQQLQDASGEEDGPASWAWVSWLLVAACVAPALLLAEAARRVLGGDYDVEYFGNSSGAASTLGETFYVPDVSTGQRFTVLWVQLDLPGPLLGPGLAALAAAGIVLVGRPARLVPDRWGRRIAACGLWLGAAQALAALVGLLQIVAGGGLGEGRPALQLSWYGAPEGFPEAAGAVAVLLPVALLTAAAGVVVWSGGRAGVPAGAPDGEPRREPVAGDVPTAPDRLEPSGTPEALPVEVHRPHPQHAVDQAPPQRFPTVPDTDRALYRRP